MNWWSGKGSWIDAVVWDGPVVQTLPSVDDAIRYLERRVNDLARDGVTRSSLVAGIDGTDPTAVRTLLVTRDEFARCCDLEPFATMVWCLEHRSDELLHLLDVGGSGTVPLEHMLARLEAQP